MVFARRIRCHFCGDRSPHTKSSGITEFQCAGCEAVNYLDRNGDIIDTPATAVAHAARTSPEPPRIAQSFSWSRQGTPDVQQSASFCKTCEHNQRIYMETLSNYLPDEEHSEYQKYEDALPQFKADLQKRYPQICKRCAPAAQTALNRADYNARTYDIGRQCNDTQAGRGRSKVGKRDDLRKWSMRLLLSFLGLVSFACLFVQAGWHLSSIFDIVQGSGLFGSQKMDEDEFVFEPTSEDWIPMPTSSASDSMWSRQLTPWVSTSLWVSLVLAWFNPGMQEWYHHTNRIEAVTGQTEYFSMHAILLVVRFVAWTKLSDPRFKAGITTQQLLAAHGFMTFLIFIVQIISKRAIKPVLWRYRFKLTPKPNERDVFGASSGLLEDEGSPPQASSVPPYELFARDRDVPFPIANLAPRHRKGNKPMSVASLSDGPPSPPRTDSDDGEAMDIDWEASAQSQMPGTQPNRTFRPKNAHADQQAFGARSTHNYENTQPSGWGAMRNEAFNIQTAAQKETELRMRKEEERTKLRYQPPAEQNPFRGRLPQAPMSMERKLRNPPSQFGFKKTPLSKQQDFMNQMRNGIQGGTTFTGEPTTAAENLPKMNIYDHNDDVEQSPAKSRTRGQLDLRKSTWQLPNDAAAATGLEDLFGGNTFSLGEEAVVAPSGETVTIVHRETSRQPKWIFGLAGVILLLAVAMGVRPIRRAACLYIVAKIEESGWA